MHHSRQPDLIGVVTHYIVGYKKEESDVLLKFLYDHIAYGADFQARVKWEAKTVVVWDNRVTGHTAIMDWVNVSAMSVTIFAIHLADHLHRVSVVILPASLLKRSVHMRLHSKANRLRGGGYLRTTSEAAVVFFRSFA